MRICIAYDCLFPWTVGGAERWYRNLAERLADDGHEVTYLTRRQWAAADPPQIPGVHVIAVSRADELYGADGNRLAGPPLRFGFGVLRHLLRNGRGYDVVHLCSFPYFPVLAAALIRPFARFRLVVDWFEVWSPEYWRGYLGPVGGRIGLQVQKTCARAPQVAHCFSARHAERLAEQGLKSPPVIIGGLYGGPTEPQPTRAAEDLVLCAGRQIAEKNIPAAIEAVAQVRARGVPLHALILGDGPEHAVVHDRIAALGLTDVVDAPGFVSSEELENAMGRALCLVHPSSREGYGLVVVEAAAHGTPVVVIDHPDNAAAELVIPGVNGFIAKSASAADLADAIIAIRDAGQPLRESTAAWFAANATRLSLENSLSLVAASYSGPPAPSANRVWLTGSMPELKHQLSRARLRADRLLTGVLKALGLRETVYRRVIQRRRQRRLREEATGSDRLSRPALHQIDAKLDAIIDIDGGFFVEAGANDGYTQSNTYWLERFRGWEGLLVEPMQELFDECLVERPNSQVRCAALVSFGYGEPTVRMRFGHLMSSVVDESIDNERTAAGVAQGWQDSYETDVPAVTLSALLDQVGAPEIDLLSLDVEGFEPEVLAGLNLDRHAPRWIVIEAHNFSEGRPPIDAILGDRYRFQAEISPVDLLYRRADVPEPSTRS